MSRFKTLDKDVDLGSGVLDYPTGPGGKSVEFLPGFKDGETKIIRFLPPVGEMELPYVAQAMHYCGVFPNSSGFTVPGDDKQRAILCKESHNLGECLLCDLNRWVREQNEINETDNSDASGLSIRHLMNVLWDDGRTVTGYIWGAPKGVMDFITQQNQRIKSKSGLGIFDLKEGYWADVARRGKKYNCTIVPDKDDVTDIAEEYADRFPDLNRFIKVLPDNVVMQIIQMNLSSKYPLKKVFTAKQLALAEATTTQSRASRTSRASRMQAAKTAKKVAKKTAGKGKKK